MTDAETLRCSRDTPGQSVSAGRKLHSGAQSMVIRADRYDWVGLPSSPADLHKVCMYDIAMAESTSTVNISFREDLLKEIDEVARSESRSRSELVREAARMYIERKKRLDSLIGFVRRRANEQRLSEADVGAEIKAYRNNRRS